jgi:hypothetical protein
MTVQRIAAAFGLLLLALAGVACSSDRGDLTVRGEESRTLYAQSFDEAYVGHRGDGEYDIMLVQRAKRSDRSSKRSWKASLGLTGAPPAAPLQPIEPAQVLQQVVHIHVFWKGNGGSVARDGVVTNSTLDWYVIGDATSDGPQWLQYEGAAYVLINEHGKSAAIDIRDGRMRKKGSTGALRDPIGPATLAGSVEAVRNDAIVQQMLAELSAQTSPRTAVGLTQ